MSLSENKSIKQRKIEIETFALNDGCHNVDGLCTFYHGICRWNENFFGCKLDYEYKISSDQDILQNNRLRNRLKNNRQSFECAGCFLRQLDNAKVTHLKISGRGMHIIKTLNDIKYLKILTTNLQKENFKQFAQNKYKQIYGEYCNKNCYY